MKCLEKNQCVHCIDYGMNNSFKVKWIFDGLLIMYVFRGKHVFYGRKRKLWTLSLHNIVCPCGPWLMKPCVEKSFPDVAWMAQGLEISFCSLDAVIDHSSSPLFSQCPLHSWLFTQPTPVHLLWRVNLGYLDDIDWYIHLRSLHLQWDSN